MTLTFTCTDGSTDEIAIVSSLLNSFITSPETYTKLVFTGKYLKNDSVEVEYTDEDPIDADTDISTSGGTETINPSLFGEESFSDGVYYFLIELYGEAGIETDSGCVFVGCEMNQCSNSNSILDIVDNKTKTDDKLMTLLYYYLLNNAADCPCECSKFVDIYLDLTKLKCPSC